MKQRIFLKIYKNGSIQKIQQIDLQQMAFGSSPDVEVHLEDDSISPWHALIEQKDNDFKISDLGSTEGTFVNDEKIVECSLKHGDQIKIGDYMMEFFIGAPYTAQAEKKESASSQKKSAKVVSKAPPKAKKPKKPAKIKKKKVKPAKKSLEKKVSSVKEDIPPSPAEPIEDILPQEKQQPEEPAPRELNQTFGSGHPWKRFLSLIDSKKTYAPPSVIKDLDTVILPGSGNNVEVLVAWGERVISVYHSTKDEIISIGAGDKATIQVPNLVQKEPYPLVHSGQIAQIALAKGMTGKIITRKRTVDFDFALKKGVITQKPSGESTLSLGQNEVVRINFHPMLRIYIRYTTATAKAQKGLIFDFNESELVGIGIAICLMMVFFFYVAVYYPRKMSEEEKIDQRKVRFATIEFKPPVRKKLVQMKVEKKAVRKKRNLPIAQKKKPKKPRKKTPQIKKKGKLGKIGGVKKKPKAKTKRKQVTSARSGGSGIKSRKQGSRAKSPKVDPTQVGLLGVFGKGGVKKKLDKAFSGAGELSGLADQATGFTGNVEKYEGEGIGTKFKSAGAGGKGANLIGISGISTRGKGGGTKGFGRGGDLGTRGRLQLSFGISDIDVEGSIDRNAIKRVVVRNKKQLERCHSRVLQSDPSIQGRILVEWVIEGSRVTGVRIKSNQSGSSQLANCVMSRLRNWRFPGAVPAGGKGVVSFPFVFTGD